MSRAVRSWALALLLLAPPAAVSAQEADEGEPDFFTFGAGIFNFNEDFIDEDDGAGQFDLQFRFNEELWIFKPHVGAFVTTDAGFYAYAGVLVDLFFGRRFVLTGSTAFGAYGKGNGLDLGGPVEFRSTIELAYRFDDRSRLGFSFGHLSNAGIHDENPGENFLILQYSLPTGVFSR